MNRRLIVVDTETAGLDPREHSILSLGAVIYQDGSISGEFHTLIKESKLSVQGLTEEQRAEGLKDAFEVNGIRVSDLLAAPMPWMVVQQFKQWLLKNELYGKQTLVAHNACFDSGFLRRLWDLAGEDYDKVWDYRMLCTQTAALLLAQAGRLELPGGSASLNNVAEVFGLKREATRHDSLEDATLAAKVLAKMVDKIKH